MCRIGGTGLGFWCGEFGVVFVESGSRTFGVDLWPENLAVWCGFSGFWLANVISGF